MLGTATFVTPLAVLGVPPQLLKHGVHDMVGAAVDELCIVIEQLSDRRLDADFSRHNDCLLFNNWHWTSSLSELQFLQTLRPWKKVRHAFCAEGRERPRNTFW